MSGKMVRVEKSQDGDSGGIVMWYADYAKPNGSFVKNDEAELTFVPNRLPPAIDFDTDLIQLQIKAERRVAEIKGMRDAVPNPSMLIRAYINREAVLSSRIEGTSATMGDLNKYEAIGGILNPASDKTGLQEVINYVKALNQILEKMLSRECKLDLDLILQAHKILMHGVRGGVMNPGQLRIVQNYIVRHSGKVRQVRYVPPPHGQVQHMLEDMMDFLRKTPDGKTSGLVQCAMAHYQFEAIHPFLDGNGRAGRLLLPVILHFKGNLPDPLLYLSAYFEQHREEYYARLRGVSQRQEWYEWLWFFFEAVIDQADESIKTIRELRNLKAKYEEILTKKKAGLGAFAVLNSLFANPYTTVPRACKVLGMTYPAGKKAVDTLVEAGILQQVRVKYRGKVFHAEEIDAVIGKD